MGATGVWALLIAAGVVVLALVGLAVLTERPRTPRPDPAELQAAAEELAAHAAAAQAEAGRAAAIAIESRDTLAAAERARYEAWAAQEAADRGYDGAWRAALAGREAAALAAQETAAGAGAAGAMDGPERERAVSRAALSAYRRGDISVQELREVFHRAGDWDPAQEERERAADRCRIQQAAARRVHDRAAAAARRAEQEAQVAEVAAQALVDEAAESAVEAHEALLAAQRYARRRGLPRQRRRPG